MTLQRYQTCLGFLNLPSNELEWFPKWLKAYSAFPSVVADRTSQPDHSVKRELVIECDCPGTGLPGDRANSVRHSVCRSRCGYIAAC